MPENTPNPKPSSPSKSIPAKLLSSVVRPAFRTLEIKKDRGQLTRTVDSDPETNLVGSKSPGKLATKTFDPADNVGNGPTAPRAGVKPVRRPGMTRLPDKAAAALRNDPNYVPEPHLHRRKSGGYFGIFLVIFVCVAFGAYTLGYLPLDQLFDQGNAAVQSHNDQLVNFILHRFGPILGIAFGGVLVVMLLKSLFGSKEI